MVGIYYRRCIGRAVSVYFVCVFTVYFWLLVGRKERLIDNGHRIYHLIYHIIHHSIHHSIVFTVVIVPTTVLQVL